MGVGAPARGRRWRLTGRGWTLLVAGAGLLGAWAVTHRAELLFLGALAVLLPVAGVLFTLRPASGAEPSRRLNTRHGAPFVGVEALLVHPDDGADWFDTFPEEWVVDRVGDRVSALPVHRGVVVLGPVVRVDVDPFGTVGVRSEHGRSTEFVVWPEVIPGARVPSARFHSEPGRRFRAGSGQDEVGVREYRAGDPLRQVHWKQTAHRDELMVRETNAEQRVRLRLFLVVPAATADREAEEAVALVASVADESLASGVDVEIHLGTAVPTFSAAERSGMLTALARLDVRAGIMPTARLRADDVCVTTADPDGLPGAGVTVLAVAHADAAVRVEHVAGGNVIVTGPDADSVVDALGTTP
ncbi:DUF58 domain-containing protein [Mycetocola reblochoni]|uniref:DUF58 domain-containing protein n=2 Tax=Mycetocola reblochoni TaxID=331618 RepID=A0A1R4JBX7_9MICO|nr:DUF58 domain-containing protein [Mycetocola reblochoni]RLP70013.1 DUF58 domain-containing protein [Mycetocola reblochoni]SJN29295.1 hypothetical protein FM119_06500 [Mycetocola reblochoni REB411]